MKISRFFCLIALALSCLHLQAQDKTASPDPKAAALVKLDFVLTDVNAVLRLYESLTGFKIITDNFVQGKISISVAEPVSRDKAIQIIERTLVGNGYAIVQIDPDTVEILGTGRNARSHGVPTISDAKDLPSGERIISYLFKLKHLNPEKIQRVFAQYLSPPQAYTSFLIVPEANALWVTERTSVIRQLIKVIAEVDIPESTATPSP
jgi:type II secretory pathway component GspD/PulD (secretin)